MYDGRVSMGWAMCSVRIRKNVLRCYRCLEYGHRSVECNDPDRSKNCFKCGSEGLRTNKCERPPCCINYKRDGHRAAAMSCPPFRMRMRER